MGVYTQGENMTNGYQPDKPMTQEEIATPTKGGSGVEQLNSTRAFTSLSNQVNGLITLVSSLIDSAREHETRIDCLEKGVSYREYKACMGFFEPIIKNFIGNPNIPQTWEALQQVIETELEKRMPHDYDVEVEND
jgi:hypothetical protein